MTDKSTASIDSVLIIGYGNMASAMVEGWLSAGYDTAMFTAYHPSRASAAHGIKMVNALPDTHFDAVILGVKPQKLGEIAPDVARFGEQGATFISILAGTPLARLAHYFPAAARDGGIVRLMPNMAAAIRKSATAMIAQGLSPARRDVVTRMACDLGSAEWIADEEQFDLVTALAGSGPGFLYRFIDALASSAHEMGLPLDQAERLALAMVEGAAGLASASDLSPHQLAERVASPGGMTREGLNVLDADLALDRLVRACLRAARDRGRELAIGSVPR